MRPTAPSGNMTPPIRPTGWWRANWRRAWNTALARVAETEGKIAAHDAATPTAVVDPPALATLAADLKPSGLPPQPMRTKKAHRATVSRSVADIDPEAAEIVLVVHWIGGVHSEMRLPRRRRGQRNSTAADVIAAVRRADRQ